jgi:hypothetical protein
MPAALHPQEDFWYSFLLEAKLTPGPIVQLEGLGQLKNPMISLNMSKYNLKPVNMSM